MTRFMTVDGNEAAARIAHRINEVIAIYPITPASPMGELCDAWSAVGRENLWGVVPEVIEMQSEGGAAGAVHGSLQAGALTTTFTASQGLLLMLPNMFKIAGELTPTVFHVAARAVATHALSIFGDHSDVMAVRSAGWGMLVAGSVQEAHDFALISQAVSLRARVPFVHFFDGFRTSHELNKVQEIDDPTIRALIREDLVQEHRRRALNPDRPVLRGSAQNPDVFFQAREAANPFYRAVPGVFAEVAEEFARRTGRAYRAFDYYGAPDATRVVVMMGSGCGAAEEAVDALQARGAKVGLLKVRLFRPLAVDQLVATLPATVTNLAVLDRTKEPGGAGEPLYQDVVCALAREWRGQHRSDVPRVVAGRYGLGGKEFTPAMVAAVFAELAQESPRHDLTLGIVDDVSHTSPLWDDDAFLEPADVRRSVFFGLGSDGTVGANKNSVKIIATHTDQFAQGYFVYDSKKAGSVTVSHLRFGPRPIRSTYQIRQAEFVGCHQFQFLERPDVLQVAAPEATLLVNSPYGADDVWDHIPAAAQRVILDRRLRVFVIDAAAVAREAGLDRRINTVMQTAFFVLSGILPREEAVGRIKDSIDETYGRRGETVLKRNHDAVDRTLGGLQEVDLSGRVLVSRSVATIDPAGESFVDRVTRILMEGRGDLLPVSAMPVDGTFPTGTARLEKRSIATEIPIWDPAICIECALCALVCPHAAIRTKVYSSNGSPSDGFPSREWSAKDLPGHLLTVQVAPDDCTGCGVCVDVCPARSKEDVSHKAINMEPKLEHLERERVYFDHFLQIPDFAREQLKRDVKGSQLLEPLFEFSGACAGCGETPYLKLLSQLFGDRAIIANATGCSSIYGGNLPTTPWSTNAEGRGPAWSNSLFEDNAEFGLGMRLALDRLQDEAALLLTKHRSTLGPELVDAILEESSAEEEALQRQRARVASIRELLSRLPRDDARRLGESLDTLVPRSVWIVGGDGWAYDIGFGGLDHVLGSGRNVNVLVLDTEVYSNTGGQASKSTPRAAIAKFASGGKATPKKDLGMIAMAYGEVYVAQIAMGANPRQTVRTFMEAEAYEGPSLILAYSPCIAHGIDMSKVMSHQKDATDSGYWPLYRFDPRRSETTGLPFQLDSRRPRLSFQQFARKEARFAVLARANPQRAAELSAKAQEDIDRRWHLYEQMTGVDRSRGDSHVSQEDES